MLHALLGLLLFQDGGRDTPRLKCRHLGGDSGRALPKSTLPSDHDRCLNPTSSPRHPRRGTHRAGFGHEPTRLALESLSPIPPGHFCSSLKSKPPPEQGLNSSGGTSRKVSYRVGWPLSMGEWRYRKLLAKRSLFLLLWRSISPPAIRHVAHILVQRCLAQLAQISVCQDLR